VVLMMELMEKVDEVMSRDIDASEKAKELLEISKELCRIRRVDHRRMKLKMERERWNLEKAELQREKDMKDREERQEKLMEPIKAGKTKNRMLIAWGINEHGRIVADYITAVRHDLPLPEISKEMLQSEAQLANAIELGRGRESGKGGGNFESPTSNVQRSKADGAGESQSKVHGSQVQNQTKGNVERPMTESPSASEWVRPEVEERREAA
jgi:hypothetical protein